jgi:hypothetical protein
MFLDYFSALSFSDFSHFLNFLPFVLPFFRLFAVFQAFCHFLDFLPFRFACFCIPYSRIFTVLCMFLETRFSFMFGRLVSRLDTAILLMGFLKGFMIDYAGAQFFPVC